EGVLAEAREYGRARPSRWHTGTWPDHTAADPQALTVFGELTVLTRSAGALAHQAVDAAEAGLARGGDLTHEECAEMSLLVATAADTQALSVFGELTALTRSAGALADQAVDAVEAGLARGGDLSHEVCAEMSVLVAMAEAAASRAAQECTARALDVVGVRSAAA